MRTEFAKLLKSLRKNMPGLNVDLIRHAYRVADRAHRGQVRLSGEPYVSHSLAVARILAGLSLDSTTIAAGLLHDVIEDTPVDRFHLEQEFGPEITLLVDGVTKIGTLYSFSPDQQQVEKQAASIRKMLVATAKDVRVLLIKLADRLHNMRTIEYLPPDRIYHISQETLNIYAPLAHRLGIARWKWELEDHAFHRLNPVEYKNMASLVTMKRREREAWLEKIRKYLEERLHDAQIKTTVIGRPKHLYSIHRKMMMQGKTFDEVMDVQAVRIITNSEADCYSALGVIHLLWKPLPGRFKDYIPMPKANGYRSIHTTVMTEDGLPLEIQIRTQEMDETAQFGIAAHWLYKGGNEEFDEDLEEHVKWLRQMYEWLQETHSADEFMDEVIRGVQMAEVFVFTPKGDVKELPAGATPLDFAYAIHSDVGHRCIGARVNGRLVPLSYNLQTGDRVEIMTSKNQTPHIGWINMVVTAKARTKIRQRLRELGALDPIEQKPKTPGPAQPRPPLQPYKPQEVRVVDDATRNKLIRVQGVKNMAVQFAKCCNPMPGQAITGYITKAPGLSIHRVDCRLFEHTTHDPKRIVRASWEGERQLQVGMQVKMAPRPNILADINEAIRPVVIDIINANYQAGSNGESSFDFIFNTTEQSRVEQVARTIRCVVGVRSITTLFIRDLQDLH